MLDDPSIRLPGDEAGPKACGPLLDSLTGTERACGGPLVSRSPQGTGTGILTPLGEQLCQQARDYLQPARMRR